MAMSHAEAGKRGGEVLAAKRRAAGIKAKPKAEPKLCICGCGDMTKGGNFCMGHDARHKRNLIALVLNEPGTPDAMDAEAELEERGWTKFLDKSREVSSKPKRERKAEASKVKVEASVERIGSMKEAAERLKEVGRYKKGDNQLVITKTNAAVIIDLNSRTLETITQEDLDAM